MVEKVRRIRRARSSDWGAVGGPFKIDASNLDGRLLDLPPLAPRGLLHARECCISDQPNPPGPPISHGARILRATGDETATTGPASPRLSILGELPLSKTPQYNTYLGPLPASGVGEVILLAVHLRLTVSEY